MARASCRAAVHYTLESNPNVMRLSNQVKYGLSILAISFSAQSALAASDWQINPLGSGAAGASTVSALNVGGLGFVQKTPDATTPALFTFIEHGAYQVFSPGSLSPFPDREITVTYSVSGSGNSDNPGALQMSAGQIDIFSDANRDFGTMAPNYGAGNGTRIASFTVNFGYVANAEGLVIVNSTGVAGSFAQGYLFDAGGNDLATLSEVRLQLGLYNQLTLPDAAIMSGVVCGIAGACQGGPVSFSPLAFTVRDSGSVSISAVPEPETSAMLLAGIGLIAAVARRRRR